MNKFLLSTAAVFALTLGALPARAAYDTTCQLQDWYQRYLCRPLDAPGLSYWSAAFQTGATPEEVQAGILASDEYYYHHGNTPVGFVAGLYQDVLGRAPLPDEVNLWVARLQPDCSRTRLALEFVTASRVELGQRTAVVAAPAYVLAPAAVAPVVTTTYRVAVPAPLPVVVYHHGHDYGREHGKPHHEHWR